MQKRSKLHRPTISVLSVLYKVWLLSTPTQSFFLSLIISTTVLDNDRNLHSTKTFMTRRVDSRHSTTHKYPSLLIPPSLWGASAWNGVHGATPHNNAYATPSVGTVRSTTQWTWLQKHWATTTTALLTTLVQIPPSTWAVPTISISQPGVVIPCPPTPLLPDISDIVYPGRLPEDGSVGG